MVVNETGDHGMVDHLSHSRAKKLHRLGPQSLLPRSSQLSEHSESDELGELGPHPLDPLKKIPHPHQKGKLPDQSGPLPLQAPLKLQENLAVQDNRSGTGQISDWAGLLSQIDSAQHVTLSLSPHFSMGGYSGNTKHIDGNHFEQIVTINGNGAVLDAAKKGQFFYVGPSGSLTLRSMTLKNGYYTDIEGHCGGFIHLSNGGGAIQIFAGSVTVDQVHFSSCTVCAVSLLYSDV